MSNNNENVTLDQMMSRAPRTGSGITMDLTAKNPIREVSAGHSDVVKTPNSETVSAEATSDATPKQYRATAINAGPVNFENAQTIDVHKILPSKPANVSVENNPLMSELDMAVDREINRISQLHEDIAAKQEEERQKVEDQEAVAAQNAEDARNILGSFRAEDDDDDDLGLDDGETDVANDHHFPIIHTNQHMFDEETTTEPTKANTGVSTYNPLENRRFNMTEINNVSKESTVSDVITQESNVKNDSATPVTTVSDDLPFTMADEAPKTTPIKETIHVEESTPVAEPSIRILDSVPNEDLMEEDDTDNVDIDSSDSNKLFEDLKTEVKQKITPIRNKINLAAFTIAQKSQSAQKVMRLAVQPHRNIADWVMYSAERPISVTGLSGPEILKLNPENSGRNRLNTFRDMYRVIYDHVYDGNKPEFETWLKQVRFNDLQHIYFALYMATFGGSNFLSYSCPNKKCNKVFIKDVEFKDMVKYASDEAKQKVQSILKLDTTSPSNDTYPVDLVQISDSYVFGLRIPSVWNVIIETASLSDKFLEKHGDLIDIVAYIDSIYYIDTVNNQLIPVDTKPDPNDQAKTSARRIKVFYDIIQQLSSEEYFNLGAAIKEYDNPGEQVTYMIPACTCPDCATEIPANDKISPDSMLFTRHQLAAIGNM